MPTYEYESADGERVERFFRMSEAPDQILVGGRSFKKMISATFEFRVAKHDPYICHSQSPAKMKGCKLVRDPRSGRMKPLIEGKRHEAEVMAINNLAKDDGDYDDTRYSKD